MTSPGSTAAGWGLGDGQEGAYLVVTTSLQSSDLLSRGGQCPALGARRGASFSQVAILVNVETVLVAWDQSCEGSCDQGACKGVLLLE